MYSVVNELFRVSLLFDVPFCCSMLKFSSLLDIMIIRDVIVDVLVIY